MKYLYYMQMNYGNKDLEKYFVVKNRSDINIKKKV